MACQVCSRSQWPPSRCPGLPCLPSAPLPTPRRCACGLATGSQGVLGPGLLAFASQHWLAVLLWVWLAEREHLPGCKALQRRVWLQDYLRLGSGVLCLTLEKLLSVLGLGLLLGGRSRPQTVFRDWLPSFVGSVAAKSRRTHLNRGLDTWRNWRRNVQGKNVQGSLLCFACFDLSALHTVKNICAVSDFVSA